VAVLQTGRTRAVCGPLGSWLGPEGDAPASYELTVVGAFDGREAHVDVVAQAAILPLTIRPFVSLAI
jgi:hypothetical protein